MPQLPRIVVCLSRPVRLATISRQLQETGHSRIGAVFATHNAVSIDLAIKLIEKYQLARRDESEEKFIVPSEVAGSIAFAQLYGEFTRWVKSGKLW